MLCCKPQTKIFKNGFISTGKNIVSGVTTTGSSLVETNSDGVRVRYKKVNLTCPNYKEATMVDTGIAYDKYLSIYVSINTNKAIIELVNNFNFVTTKGNTNLMVTNKSTHRFSGKPMTLYIQYEE